MKNKKLVAKIMLLVLLLTSALSFAGCAKKGKYIFFSGWHDSKGTIQSNAYISDNTFDINNVNVDVYYGIHRLNIFGQVKSNPKGQLPETYWKSKLVLSICICNGVHMSNYKDINCCVEIKTVSEEDLFSKDFGYIDTPFFISNGIIYKHGENIQIPSYMFDQDSGTITIRLMLFRDNTDVNIKTGKAVPLCQNYFVIDYQKTNENQVVLSGYWK